MTMGIKLGRVVTYHEVVPPTELHELLITWYFKVTWQTSFIITPLQAFLGDAYVCTHIHRTKKEDGTLNRRSSIDRKHEN